jgi:hypothetical protein
VKDDVGVRYKKLSNKNEFRENQRSDNRNRTLLRA